MPRASHSPFSSRRRRRSPVPPTPRCCARCRLERPPSRVVPSHRRAPRPGPGSARRRRRVPGRLLPRPDPQPSRRPAHRPAQRHCCTCTRLPCTRRDGDFAPNPEQHHGPADPIGWAHPTNELGPTTRDDEIASPYIAVEDPYLPPLPWQRIDDVTAENAFPDPHQVPTDRIRELNQQALAYFESCYPRSWAPSYLRGRLHTDPSDPSTQPTLFAVGYAPGSGRSLLRHLTSRGATLDELDQAGLASRRVRDDGTTYYTDFFKDRLVLPIRDPHDPTGQAILGFLGRRNPTKTDGDHTREHAGPKYLNTRTTSIFTKGEALFGYVETSHLLAAGALPVIVEGPIDAIAITLGSGGAAVGIAPMGTALTVSQIKLLRAHIDLVNGRDHIAVATDADPAGWTSAQKDFWHLTAADLDPTHLALPEGMDPAKLLQTQGKRRSQRSSRIRSHSATR